MSGGWRKGREGEERGVGGMRGGEGEREEEEEGEGGLRVQGDAVQVLFALCEVQVRGRDRSLWRAPGGATGVAGPNLETNSGVERRDCC